jgi:hypothetical protein
LLEQCMEHESEYLVTAHSAVCEKNKAQKEYWN